MSLTGFMIWTKTPQTCLNSAMTQTHFIVYPTCSSNQGR